MNGKELLQKYYAMVTGECHAEDRHEISRIEQGSFLVNPVTQDIRFVDTGSVGLKHRTHNRISVITEVNNLIRFVDYIDLSKAVGPRWAIKGYLKKSMNKDAADVVYAAIR